MAKLQNFLRRPRYLRAIPSLVVLTTAMAWGVSPDTDALDNVHRKATVTVSQTSYSAAPGEPVRQDPRNPLLD